MATPAATPQPGGMAIPLVDLSPLRQSPADAAAVQRLAAEVDRACRQVGFLYVSGHGVSEEEMHRLLGLARRLFDLPRAAKEGVDASKSTLARGYNSLEEGRHSCTPEDGRQDVKASQRVAAAAGGATCCRHTQAAAQAGSLLDVVSAHADRRLPEGFTLGVVCESTRPPSSPQLLPSSPQPLPTSAQPQESFTLGVERVAGDLRPPSPMHGPNQWPPEALLPGWRPEAEAAFQSLLSVARLLMRALALALRQPEAFFTDKCDDPVAQLVQFRYPPTGGGSDAARGCGAHTDCGFLTFVCQDAPGIEVQLADGSWFAAPSIPGTFLVNLGDLAQRWTGDVYKSTVHRVVNRSASITRHSAVFFCNTNFDALVETIVPEGSGGSGGSGGNDGGGSDGGGSSVAAGSGAEGGASAPHLYPPVTAGKYILEKLGLMWD